jgi:hypothetical protein
VIALLNEGSQILFWNYMSMALRGGGVFLPLSVAVFFPGNLHKGWVSRFHCFQHLRGHRGYGQSRRQSSRCLWAWR